MQQKNDLQLDKLLGKLMKEINAEVPSTDFTANLMMQLQAVTHTTVFTYKPLISKTGWFIIAMLVIGLLSVVMVNAGSPKPAWQTPITFNDLYQRIPTGFSRIKFSMVSLYAVTLTTILFFIQIPFLLSRYHKLMGW